MADSDAASDALSWGGDVPQGTNLLLAGPPMTGKREVMYHLLAGDRSPDRGRIVVTTRKSADAVESEYADVHPGVEEERLAIVDCVGGREHFGEEESFRRYTSDPGDLTGIGIHVSEFMRQFQADQKLASSRLGLHTLSTMLMYADLRRVYQFIHVMTGRISTSGFVGVFVMDESPGSQRLDTLVQPFDGLVEVRMADRREVRVRGVDVGPREWAPF